MSEHLEPTESGLESPRNKSSAKGSAETRGQSAIEQALRKLGGLAEGEHAEAFSREETVSGKQIFSEEDAERIADILSQLQKEFPIEINYGTLFGRFGEELKENSIQEVLTDSGRTLRAIMDEGQAARELYQLTVTLLENALEQNVIENQLTLASSEEERVAIIQKTDSSQFADGAFVRKLLYTNKSKAIAEAIVKKLPQRVDIDFQDFSTSISTLLDLYPSLAVDFMKPCDIRESNIRRFSVLMREVLGRGIPEDELCAALSKTNFIFDDSFIDTKSFSALPESIQQIFSMRMMNDTKVFLLTPETAPKTREGWEKFLEKISHVGMESATKLIAYLQGYRDLQEKVFRVSPFYKKNLSANDIAYGIQLIEKNNGMGGYILNCISVTAHVPEFREKLAAGLKKIEEAEKKITTANSKNHSTIEAELEKARQEFLQILLAAENIALERIPPTETIDWLYAFRDDITKHLRDSYEHGHADGVIAASNELSPPALGVALSGELEGNIFFTAPLEALARKAGGKEKVYGMIRPILQENGMLMDFFANISSRGRLAELIPADEQMRQTYFADFVSALDSDSTENMERFFSGVDKIIQDPTLGRDVQEVLLKKYTSVANETKRAALGFAILKAWNLFQPEIQEKYAATYENISKTYSEQMADMETLPGNEWLADGKITVKKIFTPGRILDHIRDIQALLPEEQRAEAMRVIFEKRSLKTALKDPVFASLSTEQKQTFTSYEHSLKSDLEHQEGYMGMSVYELVSDGYKITEGSFKIIDAAKGVFVTSDRVVLTKTINGKKIEMICEKSYDATADMSSALADTSVDMIELRAHCWDIDESFMQEVNNPANKKAVLIGACGGFNTVGSILSDYMKGVIPQFMGTTGEGYGPINQEISNALLEAVTSEKFQTWTQVGEYIRGRLEEKFTSGENKSRLARYVLPGSFSSLMAHLKAYSKKSGPAEESSSSTRH